MADKLTGSKRQEALEKLPRWKEIDRRDGITRTFIFTDFSAAFAFMTRVALRAEQMDHHPEWFNVYNRLEVTLATHDASGVTQKDIDLAIFMDGLAVS